MKKLGVLIPLTLFLLSNCENPAPKTLLVLHAGSLSVPFEQLEKAFEVRNPGVSVRREVAGSRACARKITELNTPADIFASADSEVIRYLLIPEFADFCIDFAANEMVLMFNNDSRYADRINSENWYDILLNPSVEYGNSDPNSDPCGYRTMLTWRLAEKYYRIPGLYDNLLVSRPLKNVRPKEVDLLALQEVGELDYIFIYRSVAEQHKGRYLILPDEINLKSGQLANYYRSVEVQLTGKAPGETVTRKGSPIVYGITIPKTSQNSELAVQFIAFLLGSEGQRIMAENRQPEIQPPIVDNYNALPDELKTLFEIEME